MSDTQLIKDKLDVVDLIGEYVPLKPAGINHKGLCPFHHEKTPSFMASRERQSWHCFGCNKGGDIFSFVQEIEGMEFVEALRYLANRAGVVLTERRGNEMEASQKNRIKDINQAAARFFHNFLLQMDAAREARAYVEQRGLTDATLIDWQVGFVPDQWELLTKYLLKKGFAIDDLVASGLTIKRAEADTASGRGFYDRFRGRVMFPIWDIHDTVVGFTGRVLVETEHSGGKYVNSPQTLVYDKSRVVFGLNKAKKEIKAKDLIVMVEGQMDVIACHQAGMKNVVATSGTAMTEHQVQLLKRYSSTMAMAFDADAAGQAAAKRGIDIAREAGMSVRVIRIPEGAGKDPDECLQKNPAVWQEAVVGAEDIMQWYIERALSNKNIADPRQKQLVVNEVLEEVGRIPFAVERDHWLKELATRLGEEVAVLRENIHEIKKRTEVKRTVHSERKAEPAQAITAVVPSDRLSVLLERWCALLLRFPAYFSSFLGNTTSAEALKLQTAVLSTPAFADLYALLKKQYTESNSIDINILRDAYAVRPGENLVDILLMKGELDFFALSEVEARHDVAYVQDEIIREWDKRQRKAFQYEIARAEKSGDKEKLEELLKAFSLL